MIVTQKKELRLLTPKYCESIHQTRRRPTRTIDVRVPFLHCPTYLIRSLPACGWSSHLWLALPQEPGDSCCIAGRHSPCMAYACRTSMRGGLHRVGCAGARMA